MRSIAIAPLLVVVCAIACPAVAGGRTEVSAETYAITGDTGEALLKAMDRNGPRHGLLARAMAQTRYSVDWKFNWLVSGGTCRLQSARPSLSIAYRYPELAQRVPKDLERRWKRFMSGVRKHEETHGRIARQMVTAMQKAMSGLAVKNDRKCVKAQRKIERVVDTVYADYEARQIRFDELEHREGGAVDRLLAILTRTR